MHSEPNTLVRAQTVASHLHVSVTTVYTLVRGIRGWSTIEPLPVVRKTYSAADILKELKVPRMEFDLRAVEAWRKRTGFKVREGAKRKPRGFY